MVGAAREAEALHLVVIDGGPAASAAVRAAVKAFSAAANPASPTSLAELADVVTLEAPALAWRVSGLTDAVGARSADPIDACAAELAFLVSRAGPLLGAVRRGARRVVSEGSFLTHYHTHTARAVAAHPHNEVVAMAYAALVAAMPTRVRVSLVFIGADASASDVEPSAAAHALLSWKGVTDVRRVPAGAGAETRAAEAAVELLRAGRADAAANAQSVTLCVE